MRKRILFSLGGVIIAIAIALPLLAAAQGLRSRPENHAGGALALVAAPAPMAAGATRAAEPVLESARLFLVGAILIGAAAAVRKTL